MRAMGIILFTVNTHFYFILLMSIFIYAIRPTHNPGKGLNKINIGCHEQQTIFSGCASICLTKQYENDKEHEHNSLHIH